MTLNSLSRSNLKAAVEKAGFQEVNRLVQEAVPPSLEHRVRIPYFLEVEFQASVMEVAEAYAAWVIGVGIFDSKHQQRIDDGVPKDWSIRRVLGIEGDGVFHGIGSAGLRLESRSIYSSENNIKRFALDFIHRSEGKSIINKPIKEKIPDGTVVSPVSWRTIVDIEQIRKNVVRVRHALATRYPATYFMPWKGGCPQIIKQLLKDQRVLDPVIPSKPISVSMSDAPDFVSSILMDESRLFPHLVITCPRRETKPLLDPAKLQNQLFGLVQVSVVQQGEGKDLFTDEIVRKGLGREYSVFDGGVRLYLPTFGPNTNQLKDHRLWTKRVFEPSQISGYYQIIQQAAGIVARLGFPSDFLSLISKIDQQKNLDRAAAVINKPDSASQADQTEIIKDLKGQLELAMEEADRLYKENQALEGEMARVQASEEALQDRVRRLQSDRNRKPESEDDDMVLQECAHACLAGNPTIEQSLRFLEANFSGRLFVLDSAWESSREVENFKHGKEVFKMLLTLVTSYYKHIVDGGDVETKGLFGKNGFATRDKVNLSKKGKQLRTFNYRGEDLFMERHLKIDGGDSVYETWRCHFHWDSERKLIVIGHCGKHLDFD